MLTGDHILHSVAITPTDLYPYSKRAWCSCGSWKSDAKSSEHARILRGSHFDAVVNDAADAAERAEVRS